MWDCGWHIVQQLIISMTVISIHMIDRIELNTSLSILFRLAAEFLTTVDLFIFNTN